MASRRTRAVPKLSPEDIANGLEGLIRNHARFVARAERHAVLIASQTDDMLAALRARAEKDLSKGMSEVKRERIQSAISDLQEIQDAHIIASANRIRSVSEDEARLVTAEVTKTVKAELGISLTKLSPFQLREAAAGMFQGATLTEWAEKMWLDRAFKLQREMQASYAQGEGYPEIVRRLEQVSDMTSHELEVLARTAIQGTANRAAQATYAANDDVLDGQQWVATLDSDTCERCGPLDGTEWKYRPEPGESAIDRMPEIPLHPQCRCYLAPIVAGMPAAEVPTWSEWITRQDADLQNDVLGRERAELLRSGDVDPSDFITKRGALRSVQSLRRAA